MDDIITNRIREELLRDSSLSFRRVGDDLRNGVCPGCGQKQLFVSLAKPYRVQCRRYNNCGYTATTRELYPHIFESFSQNYKTDKNPNAAAEAYMWQLRGFSEVRTRGLFVQGWKPATKLDGSKHFLASVKFPLWGNGSWERYMDEADLQQQYLVEGKAQKLGKTRITTGYAGMAWAPITEGQDGLCGDYIQPDDVIIITEGIFKSIAWTHVQDVDTGKNFKSISCLSSSNLPHKVFDKYRGKNVLWILAADGDEAGHKQAAKFKNMMTKMGEEHLVAYPENSSVDWDDLLRHGKLDYSYFQRSLWRGHYLMSTDLWEKGMLSHIGTPMRRMDAFAHGNSTWVYAIDGKEVSDADLEKNKTVVDETTNFTDFDKNYHRDHFRNIAKLKKVSNCKIDFLYTETDIVTNELYYSFNISCENGSTPQIITLTGSEIESPTALKRAILNNIPGGKFSGSATELDVVHDNLWFKKRPANVQVVRVVGYEQSSQTYMFPSFAYHNGRLLKPNKQGFIMAGQSALKCVSKNNKYTQPGEFNGNWIDDFKLAFGANGMALLGWWLGTLFACQVRKDFKKWPFFELTGDQGAGKTTLIEFLWKLCGRDEHEGFDPSAATTVAALRRFEQVSNLPVVLMEGDHYEEGQRQRGGFNIEQCKKLYDGRAIRSKGVKNRGSETEDPPFQGGLVITQNATVTASPAILSRIVHCHCDRSHFSTATGEAARRLEEMPVEELSGWMGFVLKNASKIYEGFKQTFPVVLAHWEKQKTIQNRLLLNHAFVAAWVRQLPLIFGADHFTADDIVATETHLWHRCFDRQRRLQSDHPVVEQFWDIYEYINFWFDSKAGVQMERVNLSNNPGEIAVNLGMFTEVARANAQDFIDSATLKKQLPTSIRHKFIGQRKIKHNGVTRHCWIFTKSVEKK